MQGGDLMSLNVFDKEDCFLKLVNMPGCWFLPLWLREVFGPCF